MHPDTTRLLRLVVMALAAVSIHGCGSTGRADRGSEVPSGWPVTGREVVVTSSFGAKRSGSNHRGIDISAPEGTPVKTTASGVVEFAGKSGRFGRMVLIDHGNGWKTRYAHLKKIKVNDGARLRRGEVIGTVGRSGNATGYHLHYEVIRNGSPVDPRGYL